MLSKASPWWQLELPTSDTLHQTYWQWTCKIIHCTIFYAIYSLEMFVNLTKFELQKQAIYSLRHSESESKKRRFLKKKYGKLSWKWLWIQLEQPYIYTNDTLSEKELWNTSMKLLFYCSIRFFMAFLFILHLFQDKLYALDFSSHSIVV